MESSEINRQPELAALIEAVKRSDYDFAIPGLKGFIEAHPHHEIATGLLAACYFHIGMTDRARGLYRQLLSAHPGNALARFQLGLVCLNDAPREALQIWQSLLAVQHEFMAHFHSALAYLQLGERDAAQPLLEHASKYMPDSHPLRERLNQLRGSLLRDEPYAAGSPASRDPR